MENKTSTAGYSYQVPCCKRKIIKLDRDITLYKAVKKEGPGFLQSDLILELFIPEGSLLYTENIDGNGIEDRKIRVSHAYPVGGLSLNKKSTYRTEFTERIFSRYDNFYRYDISKCQQAERKFSRRLESCADGIHGFFDVKDAIEWANL